MPLDRAHPHRALDAVGRVELRGEGPTALAEHRLPQLGVLGAQALALGTLGRFDSAASARRRARRACADCWTSRAKTTAAAGAPPITDAWAPSRRDGLELLVELLREETKAPPW